MPASMVFFAVIVNICIDYCFIKLFEAHEFISMCKGDPSTMICVFIMWLLCHLIYYSYHKDGRMYLDD